MLDFMILQSQLTFKVVYFPLQVCQVCFLSCIDMFKLLRTVSEMSYIPQTQLHTIGEMFDLVDRLRGLGTGLFGSYPF